MINIGKYIEIAINWMTEHWAHFFDVVNNIIGGFIDAFQNGLLWIPFYIMIAALTVLAWYKAGKGTAALMKFFFEISRSAFLKSAGAWKWKRWSRA